MQRPSKPCTTPGCGTLVAGGGRCPECAQRRAAVAERRRGTAADRGYGLRWPRIRAQFLRAHPACALCPSPATVADHWPLSRRDLLAAGDTHPDAWSHLRPLCSACHGRETARLQPGGWNAPGFRDA